MPSDHIADLLKDDFDELTRARECDRFAERLLYKLGAKRRARLGVVTFAGGLGAAFAASQFTSVVSALAPALAESAPEMAPELAMAGVSPQFLAILMLAGALAATALVLRQDF
ncbi:MAG: hypothetical protein CMI63_03775 [Parvularcula sp.]|uniref:hypothetical protein n=1 Tax=Hyphococcus sp. TaxID=2038636 RepID=UPI000C5DE9A7|nr:hypothetical protein [Parvularcula sp.]